MTVLRRIAACAVISLIPVVAAADEALEWVKADGTVTEVMDRLQAAVEEAGATVFARVDHAAGAEEAGMSLEQAQLLIFGNPKLGTPLMQENIRAGVVLPLRVLVFEEEGETWIIYQEVDHMLVSVNAEQDGDAVDAVIDALEGLTEKAAAAKPPASE